MLEKLWTVLLNRRRLIESKPEIVEDVVPEPLPIDEVIDEGEPYLIVSRAYGSGLFYDYRHLELHRSYSEYLVEDPKHIRIQNTVASYLVEDEKSLFIRAPGASYLTEDEKSIHALKIHVEYLTRDPESTNLGPLSGSILVQNVEWFGMCKVFGSYMTHTDSPLECAWFGADYARNDHTEGLIGGTIQGNLSFQETGVSCPANLVGEAVLETEGTNRFGFVSVNANGLMKEPDGSVGVRHFANYMVPCGLFEEIILE